MKYIKIIVLGENKKIDKDTLKFLPGSNDKIDISIANVKENDEINFIDLFHRYNHVLDKTDFVCVVPSHSIFTQSYIDIIEEYIIDKDSIYLPLVLLQTKEATGILNSSLWNSQLPEYGKLDHETALFQLDTTLYGAIIPVSYFKDESNYKKDLELYQHFYFLNKVTEEKDVVGIPKILLTIDKDMSYSNYTKEIKVEQFNKAREDWKEEKDSHTSNLKIV